MAYGLLINNIDGKYSAEYALIDDYLNDEHDVVVDVEWSTINYKDALAITGKAPVIRKFPLVPGIDFAGTVESSRHPQWRPGDKVVLNGFGVGEKYSGGLAEKAFVKGDYLIRLPQKFTTRQAMGIGTAGYTAILSLLALEKHGIKPGDGKILVTGASGGVGSIAIALLSSLGYEVIASTGNVNNHPLLHQLGAAEIISRDELSARHKPLNKERWAGAIDAVGGLTLSNVCASTSYGGAVAACGLAGGNDFPATVLPFILRGITLYGIDSVQAPLAVRENAWARLASDLDADKLELIVSEISLRQVIDKANGFFDHKFGGRVVVNIQPAH
ncbi:acrylyl-CoA reductase (NADPH) [Brenneria tiliae]|uniref:acrylyl-CoA reductase (NADPH) n=1 Tax=Brenneria tiliae TaxID=2914984 RepID=UPI002014D544|nr:MDR family oxidoreductase [Brenneria tiliae]MCL2898843.1 oxidoreductase [Brenneria tiliae]MCL2903220.1 oxidoreductase [Brenneria tiliae]